MAGRAWQGSGLNRPGGRAGANSRLQQVVDWCGGPGFDGVLVFDECHKAKNCTVTVSDKSGFATYESKTARVRPRPCLCSPPL